jgi:hypothetical protein
MLKGILLFLLATIFKSLIAPIGYIYGTISSLIKREWNIWNGDLAIAKDQYGNGICKYILNDLLIEKDSKYKFGNIDETVSSVIGKNKIADSLTHLGSFIDKILNKIEKDHSIKSIDKTE